MQIYKREIFHFTELRFGLNKIIDDHTQGRRSMFADFSCYFSKCLELLAETSKAELLSASIYSMYIVQCLQFLASFIVPGLCFGLTSF
jgi:hypothetical protein